MANNIVRLPMDYFGNPDKGTPIAHGFVYIGEPDLDPEIEINRKTVTLREEDGTEIPILANEQPLDIGAGGYVLYSGAPVQILTDDNYSIKVTDKLGAQKFYVPNVLDGVPALITDVTAGDAAVTAAFQAADAAITAAYQAADALALLKTGGTVTGQIKGIPPVADEDLVRKDYSDTNRIGDRVELTSSVGESIPFGNGSVYLAFDTELKDEADSHDTVTDNERIVVSSDYNRIKINATVFIGYDSAPTLGQINVVIEKNGFEVHGGDAAICFDDSDQRVSISTEWVDCVDTDYFRIRCRNTHASVDASTSGVNTLFHAELIKV